MQLVRTAAVALVVCLSSGCTVFSDYNDDTEEARLAFEAGDFRTAEIIYSDDLDATNDSLLYHFEAGLSAHLAKDYKRSFDLLDTAYNKVVEYQDRAIVSASDVAQTVGSFLVNEKTIPYTGAIFEQLMMQTYQARNQFLRGKRDMVLTEVLRTYDIQDKARKIYEEELKTAQGQAQTDARDNNLDVGDIEGKMRSAYVRGDLKEAGDVYDPHYVRYLNAFLRDACGTRQADFNDALIDLKFVSDRFGREEFIVRDLAELSRKAGDPAGAEAWARRLPTPTPRNAGSVALFFESGMSPFKYEFKVTFSTLNGAAAVAIPLYEKNPDAVTGALLTIGDQAAQTVMLSNVESMAFRYFSDRVPLTVAKQIIRVAAKVAVQEGGHALIENSADQSKNTDEAAVARVLADVWSFGSSLWNVISEQADLRCWRTLPRTLQATRIYLAPGTYPVSVTLLGSGGAALGTSDLGTVTIKAGKHRMINARSIGARLHWDLPAESYDQAPVADAPPDQVTASGGGEGGLAPLAAERSEASGGTAGGRSPPANHTESLMDRARRCFKSGGPLNLHLVREKGGDWFVNTTIDQAVSKTDERGPYLAVTTANYRRGGKPHYFSFVVRDGEVKRFGLLTEKNGAWKPVRTSVFAFLRSPGVTHEIVGEEALVLTCAGKTNRARGSAALTNATLHVRSFHAQGAKKLSY